MSKDRFEKKRVPWPVFFGNFVWLVALMYAICAGLWFERCMQRNWRTAGV